MSMTFQEGPGNTVLFGMEKECLVVDDEVRLWFFYELVMLIGALDGRSVQETLAGEGRMWMDLVG